MRIPHPFRSTTSSAGMLGLGLCLVTMTYAIGPVPQQGAPRPRERVPAETAVTETYTIDAVHSMALFRVRHLNAGAFWGRFNNVTGTIEFAPESQSGLRMDVVIDTTSVDTGNENLDKHVKSADFFNTEVHETATFKSTSARKMSGRKYLVTGDLTMRGVTKTISAEVEWLGTADSRMGRRGGFETTFTVMRSDYGIDYGVKAGVLGDETRIIVALEGIVGGRARAGGADAGGAGGRGATGNFLSRFDENKDGKLQREEMPERMRDRFDELDANGDGAIDEAEMRAMRGRPGGAGASGGR